MKFLKAILFSVLFSNIPVSAEFLDSLEVQGGAELPMQLGVKARANVWGKYYFTGGFGSQLSFLSESAGSLIGGLGFTGPKTGEIIGASMAGSILVDLRFGYSLQGDSGFYIEGGYAYQMGGSGETNALGLEEATGVEFSADSDTSVTLATDIHQLIVQVGYSWVLTRNFVVSAQAGFYKPFSSSVEVTVNSSVSNSERENITTETQSYFEDAFVSQVFIPTAGAWISYVF